MKKLKHLFLKCFNAILVVLLGVFGFSSCDREEPEELVKPMYGTARTEFSEKSSVFSDKDSYHLIFDTIDVELTPKEEDTNEE
jgi:hypothetical protein